ncbi:RagB/SusD family nutrient uptake outer membrane protein [Pontibacter korlensis]|uniref:Carbohydrate-binding protein SusD n=2 Tax=Pontibacter korlensis TaxID=400092 RepID=A0A0E3ZFS0_9BACT|nr:hypothetical protein PKOR_11895 [Pontibacter korlensis]
MKKIVFMMITAVLLQACDDDFLTTNPTDTFTEETFWKTETHALAGINGTYAQLQVSNLYGSINVLLLEAISPNGYNYSNSAGVNFIAEGVHDASNSASINNRWNASYKGIGRANTVVGHIDAIKMDEGLKSRIKGEAKFLRALFYANLVNFYGGVPLILDVPNIDQGSLPRSSREEVVNQIVKDLNEASEVLPLRYTNTDIGRATKGAALALQARVLAYESRWGEAAAAAKQVIDLNVYSLFPDYRELFYLENEGNEEVIFDVQLKFPEFGSNFDIYLDRYNSLAPLQDLVDSYQMIDGKSISESTLYNADNPYENRDPRLQKTVIVPGSNFKGKIVKDDAYPFTGYGQKKYSVYKDNEVPAKVVNTGDSELNYIILRYADVLLLYAEAQNEASGPDKSVYEAINKVRARAGMPAIPEGLTQNEMREAIRLERRIELAGEGLYYDDIRRWKTAETVMNTEIVDRKGHVIGVRTFNPSRDYLWPIPSVALQENPNLEQNPGYNK